MSKEPWVDILERLVRIETLLKDDGILAKLNDHEKRMRKLERFMWALLAVLGIWEAVLTAAITAVVRSLIGG